MELFHALLGKMLDKRIAAYQSDLLTKHCEEVQNIYQTMRGWRHDYHNHIQTMLALTDDPARMTAYLLTLNNDLLAVDTILKTGNTMVDAILHSKLSLITSKSIAVHAKAIVPSTLAISEIDLCVIIGNLLDNAIEACSKVQQQAPWIRVYIGVLKGQLYISISNATDGAVKKSGRIYLSTKDSHSHGFGLMRVDRIADKYHGYVNRKNEEGVFATEVMLPL